MSAGSAASSTSLVSSTQRSLKSRPPRYRADIEGLRGVAVIAVVLYHAGVPFMGGGYVGVDIFFVISGFLITGLLVDERTRSGRVRLGAFISRRVRRLLPASTLVFVTTCVMSAFLLTPLQVKDLASQARAVAVFGSNIWFSIHATDYLQPDAVSPFQQYWSLAVEEQFYLVWPLILFITCIGCATRSAVNRRVISLLLVLIVGSFGISVWLTEVRQPSAFFLLHARAWELGAGALLAVLIRNGVRPARRFVTLFGWTGLILMVAPVFLYSDTTTFPGWTALVPVIGTVLALFAGSEPFGESETSSTGHQSGGPVEALLGCRPLTEVGRYSYSLYLWHWPLLVIAATRAGGQVAGEKRIILVGVACALSVASYHLVENRVRFSQPLVTRPALSAALAIPLVGLSLLSTVLLERAARIDLPSQSEMAGRPVVVEGKRTSFVPADLVPPLDKAIDDDALIYSDGCHHSIDQPEEPDADFGDSCRFGDLSGPELWLAGDSHAGHWFPGLESLSSMSGWRLHSTTKSTCPLMQVDVYIDTLKRDYVECNDWRTAVINGIERNPPSAVVLAQKSLYYSNHAGTDAWLSGMRETVERLSKSTEVIVFRDTPIGPNSVPSCLTVHMEDVSPCEFGVTPAEIDLAVAERKVVEGAGGHYVDPVDLVCPENRCPVVVGNILVFKDKHHLTAAFSKSLAEPLGDLLSAAWKPE